ncbi:hypothetical protein CFP65_6717 [Kitasatospora sp. MMS16-BH015]|uniref:hypothetical protein n=1 Tax=Kitasatospora sp. MMS16-BH015 TaxID=2018025 RepID=UPI000CA0EA6A|nr:hypothetical protein [Kitasatospora sp. MMS16-BH015]AUG81360.1 hypothetical protein CFP65_6717 [Kitasatospora sp. MMS16-BH015]
MTPALPLAALGLVDAAFSGFRAYAGRDARIRKHRANTRAALRGLAVGAVLLLAPALTAALHLLTAAAPDHAYAALTAGGLGYLLPLTAYAAAVLLSLTAYFVLPFRAGTLATVIGLGPLTLLRPLAIAAACLAALLHHGGWASLLIGAVAGAAMLSVEPIVHHRWYRQAHAPVER